MLDPLLRRFLAPTLDRAGGGLAALGIGADALTWTGFALGLGAIPAIATGHYLTGLALFLGNRLFDGLDGAVARRRSASDLGGYLDIVCDFIVYAGFVAAFALARPDNALPAAILLFGFMGTGSTFLAFAIFAAKRGLATTRRGPKALYYLGGLTEGTETILFFAAFCLFPATFPVLALVFAALCLLTTLSRMASAIRMLADRPG
ncbi:MAG: CDP-alcohol phosphatidyltransferase family protein [Alphaproteobacteria bacterium]|nr:CDP-alcohol phosphatidyltransferase family protein [Alphaproteobacteria bacterium]